MYKIKDCQILGRYFNDGQIFKNKDYVLSQLCIFHSIDYDDCNGKYPLDNMTIGEILEYGSWELEEI